MINLNKYVLIFKYHVAKSKSIYLSILKSLFFTSVRNFSSIRYILRITFKEFKRIDFDQIRNFLHLRIGFISKSQYYDFPLMNFISLDYFNRRSVKYYLDLRRLPVKRNKVEDIYINHFFKYFHNKRSRNKAIRNWYKKLIPGGMLKFMLNKGDKYTKNNLNQLLFTLKKNKFIELNKEKNYNLMMENGLKIFTLAFYKKSMAIEKIKRKSVIIQKKLGDIKKIINNLKIDYYYNKKVGLIGNWNIKFENIEKNAKEIKIYSFFSENNIDGNDFLEFGIIYDTLEYQNRTDFYKFFIDIKKIFRQKSKIIIIVPNQLNFYTKEYHQLFNKAILTEILDDNNLDIKWMNLDPSFKFIVVLIKNISPFPSKKLSTKIIVLGNLDSRYSQLNSFWDGMIRGLIKLGYSPLLIDLKTIPYSEILKRLENFKPDYLLTGLKISHPLLRKYAEFFRKMNICVSYWYRDARPIEDFDFSGVIDYMFLTNYGQVESYKKNFHIENVFYMPQWCNPIFTHPNPFIEEHFDIGFIGQLDSGLFHKERTKIIMNLKKKFNMQIVNDEFNSLSELYSQCKIGFGNDMDSHILLGDNLNLNNGIFNKFISYYASNRLFISIGCGTCFFTNYFPGIENLFENGKHVIWYKSYEELYTLIKKYLLDDEKRFYIKNESYKLAKSKHTYIHRIKNMLDIIMGKTKEFYGFLD